MISLIYNTAFAFLESLLTVLGTVKKKKKTHKDFPCGDFLLFNPHKSAYQ